MSTDVRAANLATLERVFAAIARGDAEAMLSDYTDDMVLELPYTNPPAMIRGKDEARVRLGRAFDALRFELTITHVHAMLDPEQLILEFTSSGRVLATNAPYANRYIAVYRFHDGRVCEQREFFHPNPS